MRTLREHFTESEKCSYYVQNNTIKNCVYKFNINLTINIKKTKFH